MRRFVDGLGKFPHARLVAASYFCHLRQLKRASGDMKAEVEQFFAESGFFKMFALHFHTDETCPGLILAASGFLFNTPPKSRQITNGGDNFFAASGVL